MISKVLADAAIDELAAIAADALTKVEVCEGAWNTAEKRAQQAEARWEYVHDRMSAPWAKQMDYLADQMDGES